MLQHSTKALVSASSMGMRRGPISREKTQQRRTPDSHTQDMGNEGGSRRTSRFGLSLSGGPDTTLPSCLACFACKGELLEGNRQVMPLCPGAKFPLAFKS